MTRERNPGVVYHRLADRRGHHGTELPRHAAIQCAVQRRQHVGAIRGIQPACLGLTTKRDMNNLDYVVSAVADLAIPCEACLQPGRARARFEQCPVADDHRTSRETAQACGDADFRSDPCRLPRGQGIGTAELSGLHVHFLQAARLRGSSAFVQTKLDVGLVAQLAQPLLVGFVRLPLAQCLPRLQAAALNTQLSGTALHDLNQVEAER